MVDIYSWSEIADEFNDGIILGNGASIAVHQGFAYKTLLERARQDQLITENINKIFQYLDAEDFEFVLRLLFDTFQINQALEIGDNVTTRAYEEVRQALIKAVRNIHIDYKDVENLLINAANFLKNFKTVASLNYDVLVYWIMYIGNSQIEGTWFKDCFVHGEFEIDWEYLRKPNKSNGSTLVFYPHGNLALATNILGRETKLSNPNEKELLLDTIIDEWESGKYSPLFVSEGNPKQKLNAIRRSVYLSTVYDTVLSSLGSKIAVFGWSMGDQDDHILEAIKKSKNDVEAFAISLYTKRSEEQIEVDCQRISTKLRQKFSNPNLGIKFFNSASNGCWITPNKQFENP
jgi:hypothetical protein